MCKNLNEDHLISHISDISMTLFYKEKPVKQPQSKTSVVGMFDNL